MLIMNDYYFHFSSLLSGIPNLGYLFFFSKHKTEFKKIVYVYLVIPLH